MGAADALGVTVHERSEPGSGLRFDGGEDGIGNHDS